MRYQLNFIVVAITSLLYSCETKKGIPQKECIRSNDAGVAYLTGNSDNIKPDLNKAVQLFEQAIQCDSNYLTAYINILNAYDQQHRYDNELSALNKILLLTNNDPAILLEKGKLFERMKQIDSAKKLYERSGKEYNKRLANAPLDVNLIRGFANFKAVTIGKTVALAELDKQITIHPELSSKLTFEYSFFKNFDRDQEVFHIQKDPSIPVDAKDVFW